MAQPTDDNDAVTKKYVDDIPYEGMNEKYFFLYYRAISGNDNHFFYVSNTNLTDFSEYNILGYNNLIEIELIFTSNTNKTLLLVYYRDLDYCGVSKINHLEAFPATSNITIRLNKKLFLDEPHILNVFKPITNDGSIPPYSTSDDIANNWDYFNENIDAKIKIKNIDSYQILKTFHKKIINSPFTNDINMNNNKIKNIKTPLARETDNAANVGFVVNEINNNNANITQQYKDWVAQSHPISSHKENVFKYLYDTDESASEYNIRVDGFEENFRESAHQNKNAYSVTMIKDTDGSNDYRSGISFNIYPLPIGTYTMIFEYYWPGSTNVSLSTQGTTVYIQKQVYREFDTYGKLLVQISNNSKTTPDRITLVIHGRAVVQNPEGCLVIYGIKGWSDSVDPRVYDGLKNEMFDFENNEMKMQVDINLNGKTNLIQYFGTINSSKIFTINDLPFTRSDAILIKKIKIIAT